MYGQPSLGVDDAVFQERLAAARLESGARDDSELDAASFSGSRPDFRTLLVEHCGEDLPAGPARAARLGGDHRVRLVERRPGPHLPSARRHLDDLGTAVSVIEMVYGNTGPRSGSGVCFTRDPATGAPGLYGDYLATVQGEDVVNGSRATSELSRLQRLLPRAYDELQHHAEALEHRFRDMCDIEFTVEDGRLWVPRFVSASAACRRLSIAVDLVDEGRIDLDEALRRVNGAQLQSLLHPQFATTAGVDSAVAVSLPALSAVGEVAFVAVTAVSWAAAGREVVLGRPETSAHDVAGMIAPTPSSRRAADSPRTRRSSHGASGVPV